MTYSYQLLASTIPFRYLYLLYSHTPVRYYYQNSFVTNHYQLHYHILLRRNRSQKFFKIYVLKNFAMLTEKHLCWCLFLIKLHALERDSNIHFFSCEYCEVFKKRFFIEHLWWLFLTPIRYPYVT